MKNLLVLIFIFIIACSEDDSDKESCYTCTLTMQITGSGVNDTSTSKVDQCGLTNEEADQMEKSGTNTITSSSGGITVTTRNTMNCIKK